MRALLIPTHRLFTAVLLILPVALPASAVAHPRHDEEASPATRPAGSADPAVAGVDDPTRFHTDRPDPKVLPVPEEKDAFTFVVFGDRTGGPDEGVEILAEAVRDANLIEPDLVMTVGDLVQGYNENPLWQQQADEFSRIMDGLECPWFPVAGNHDVYWRDTDKSGDKKPAGENERLYEMHFGPLWYAFEHKNSWFVVLFSDEGNLKTGEKTLHDAEAQRMSPEQLQWLRETLEKAKDAEHVFIFLHHPRWAGNKTHATYGDDWQKVHQVLVEAGNVTAAFAGHIHRMRYEGKIDGIEYLALATVGGGQPGTVPRAGFLHQYHVVTVRDGRISMSAIPVGAAIDPRSITPEVSQAATALASAKAQMSPPIAMSADGSAAQEFEATIQNPTPYPVSVTLAPQSRDSHWLFSPDHNHGQIAPGESGTFRFAARRLAGPVDESFDLPSLGIDAEVMAETCRIPVPTVFTPLKADLRSLRTSEPPDRVLAVDGEGDYLAVASHDLPLPADSPMTLEAWMRAESFGNRVGLVTKAQSSDYGIFVSGGRPSFTIFLGDRYTTVRGQVDSLKTGTWHHVAGVYDGREVRLYLDGELVASKRSNRPRKTNDLPLIVGGDVGGSGNAGSFFHGQIDELRLSSSARYTGDAFEPRPRLSSDEQTLLLLHFDEQVGPVLFDDAPALLQIEPQGDAHLAERAR